MRIVSSYNPKDWENKAAEPQTPPIVGSGSPARKTEAPRINKAPAKVTKTDSQETKVENKKRSAREILLDDVD